MDEERKLVNQPNGERRKQSNARVTRTSIEGCGEKTFPSLFNEIESDHQRILERDCLPAADCSRKNAPTTIELERYLRFCRKAGAVVIQFIHSLIGFYKKRHVNEMMYSLFVCSVTT